jgi:hypothetical protein
MFRIPIGIFCLLTLFGCGGGGGSSSVAETSQPASITANLLSGFVIKGPTDGATVSLFRLSENGQRAFIKSAITGADGSFSMQYSLNPGDVYLFEAVGGQYKNEIDGKVEQLSASLRAIFVASGIEKSFVLSAVSESLMIEIERSAATNKWSAALVSISEKKVLQELGLSSLYGLNYIDLQTLKGTAATNISNDDFTFSFQIGIFSGAWNEIRSRDASVSLSDALKSFQDFTVAGSDDDKLNSIFSAGLVRYVEKVPFLTEFKSRLYALAYLAPDANIAVFKGAESSGGSDGTVTNGKQRYLSIRPNAAMETTDTIFNKRGALIGFGLSKSFNSYSYLGSGSVADVFSTSDVAIGRWNRGYSYSSGVSYDKVTGVFSPNNAIATDLQGGEVYATGVPATTLPTCGKVVMSLKSLTKQFIGTDSSKPFVLDPTSKLGFQFANGAIYVGYELTMVDSQGGRSTFKSVGGAEAPSQTLESNMEFRSFDTQLSPSGESLGFSGLLVGNGGKSAVIRVYSSLKTPQSVGLAAVFTANGAVENCVTPIFSNRGLVDPLPVSGDWYDFNVSDTRLIVQSLDFFPNGTPNYIGTSGVTSASSYEKSGNSAAGIGVMAPPFTVFSIGEPFKFPVVYSYRNLGVPSGVLPTTGIGTYRLKSSTPVLVSYPSILVSAETAIQTAVLKIYFNQNPIGTISQFYGTCELKVNNEVMSYLGTYGGGGCQGVSGNYSLIGGISPLDSRFGVINFQRDRPPFKENVGLLFERE